MSPYTCECESGFEIRSRACGNRKECEEKGSKWANVDKFCGNVDDCKKEHWNEGLDKFVMPDCGVGTCLDQVSDFTCACPVGYILDWKDMKKTCVPIQCSEYTPDISYADLVSKSGRSPTNGKAYKCKPGEESKLCQFHGPLVFPAVMSYHCNEGYTTDGDPKGNKQVVISCKSNGALTGWGGCQRIECSTPRTLPFTKLVSNASMVYRLGDKASYECFEGYAERGRPDGDTTFQTRCEADGRFTLPKVCEPIRCGKPPRVPKGRPAIAGRVSYGEKLMYLCDNGYTLDHDPAGVTQFEIDCRKDGTFADLPNKEPCKPVTAGRAPRIANSEFVEYAGKPVPKGKFEGDYPIVYYPNGLEYKCWDDYSANGQPTGQTSVFSRVDSQGQLDLPKKCQSIEFRVSGIVKDERDGTPLVGVTVSMARADIETVTEEGGLFTLTGIKPRHLVTGKSNHSITLKYSKRDYVSAERTDDIFDHVEIGGFADAELTPKLVEGEWRAELTWAEEPLDLDAYARWGPTKVWTGTPKRKHIGMQGVLAVDGTEGPGPETMFLSGVGKCTAKDTQCDIRYEVSDLESKSLKSSDAKVTLYHRSGFDTVYKIEDCLKSVSKNGAWWHVFTIDGKTNELKWECTSGEAAPLAWGSVPPKPKNKTGKPGGDEKDGDPDASNKSKKMRKFIQESSGDGDLQLQFSNKVVNYHQDMKPNASAVPSVPTIPLPTLSEEVAAPAANPVLRARSVANSGVSGSSRTVNLQQKEAVAQQHAHKSWLGSIVSWWRGDPALLEKDHHSHRIVTHSTGSGAGGLRRK
jgi:hypothetical protein